MTPAAARSIPFFNYPSVYNSQAEEFTRRFRDVGRRGAFILQKDLADFEQHLAAFTGARHAAGVGNATDGLLFALRAAGLQPGDEVILSSHTMIATAAAVHFAGGIPIPVECGRDHLIDPLAAQEAVTPQTRAILPTHLNGRTCDMDELQEIADQHSLLIVEDAAQALGSRFRDRCAGTFGVASAISFYPAKILGCLGDGGAVLTNEDAIDRQIRQMRDHGRNSDGEIVSWGLNSRLDNLQAALLDWQLQDYGKTIGRRRHLAALYTGRLEDVPEVALPPSPDADPRHFDVYQNYEIEAERRDDLRSHLQHRGIGTLIPWGGQAVHQLEALGFTQRLPFTDRLFERLLMLPMNPSLADEDVHYVCDHVRAFYGYRS